MSFFASLHIWVSEKIIFLGHLTSSERSCDSFFVFMKWIMNILQMLPLNLMKPIRKHTVSDILVKHYCQILTANRCSPSPVFPAQSSLALCTCRCLSQPESAARIALSISSIPFFSVVYLMTVASVLKTSYLFFPSPELNNRNNRRGKKQM